MLGGGAHHDLGDVATAGVEDVIERFGEQRGGLVDRALDDGHDAFIEVLRHELGNRFRRRRRQLGRFDDHRVPGGQGADGRAEQQLERVVPRGDDEHHAQRLGHDLGGTRFERERQLDPGRFHPRLQVVERVVDLADRETDLRQVALDRRLAEVVRQRVGELVLVLLEHPLQLDELAPPHLFVPHDA